jgi:hypothetical protein
MANQQQSNSQSNQQQTSSNTATAAALQASASALASLLPQSTKLQQLTAALVQSQNNEMDYKMKNEDEPTDLSTSSSSDRKFIKAETDCYP